MAWCGCICIGKFAHGLILTGVFLIFPLQRETGFVTFGEACARIAHKSKVEIVPEWVLLVFGTDFSGVWCLEFGVYFLSPFRCFYDLYDNMMNETAMTSADRSDADLVADSFSGSREAFGEIVARYQSLICSLAYSATGSLSQSEDLAQETFVTAWKQLNNLREPAKLRSWLCGIARHRICDALRSQGREPAHAAESIELIAETPASEPLPHECAISREEEAVLWRSVERVPEVYREPLVLFYREHQSIERVAAALDLSEDAVKQRLSRGRKLLHEQVLAFVEGALERTNPGKAFTLGVVAALPALTLSGHAATLGATAAKGSSAAKVAAATGLAGAIFGPLLIVLGNYFGYRLGLDAAQTPGQRGFVKGFYRRLTACILGFFVVFILLMVCVGPLAETRPALFAGSLIGLALAYMLSVIALSVWSVRARRKLLVLRTDGEKMAQGAPAWEYRSKFNLLGWPLIHIRLGGGFMGQKPVKAWIAIGGPCAVGLLFAFGGTAIAPISVGGFAVGLLSWGGCGVGLLAVGGFSLGVWSWGGLALGWEAFGGCAIAWNAAAGGAAVAHDFAAGGVAVAAQANNEIAHAFVRSNSFLDTSVAISRSPFSYWLNLLWVGPMILMWWIAARRGRRAQSGSSAA